MYISCVTQLNNLFIKKHGIAALLFSSHSLSINQLSHHSAVWIQGFAGSGQVDTVKLWDMLVSEKWAIFIFNF